jgi:predicted dehydrogenase
VPRRLGIVGAGRTRNGLGPFLAAFAERAGLLVHGVSGRNTASAAAAATALAARLGHPVAVYADAGSLAADVDALIVSSPPAHHLEGLGAALAAGIPCLCEKPLVTPAQTAAGRAAVAEFTRRGLLLAENCQWPFVLPVLRELFPPARLQPVTAVAMGLSPAEPGVAMVQDSLSHLLSVAQALVPLADTEATAVALTDPTLRSPHNALTFRLRTAAGGELACALHLQVGRTQPRPAWLQVNDCRVDRRIGADYALAFAAGDRAIAVADPMQALVYGFSQQIQEPNRERAAAAANDIARRLRLYAGIIAGVDAAHGARRGGA